MFRPLPNGLVFVRLEAGLPVPPNLRRPHNKARTSLQTFKLSVGHVCFSLSPHADSLIKLFISSSNQLSHSLSLSLSHTLTHTHTHTHTMALTNVPSHTHICYPILLRTSSFLVPTEKSIRWYQLNARRVSKASERHIFFLLKLRVLSLFRRKLHS